MQSGVLSTWGVQVGWEGWLEAPVGLVREA